jgi:hypothetical protein
VPSSSGSISLPQKFVNFLKHPERTFSWAFNKVIDGIVDSPLWAKYHVGLTFRPVFTKAFSSMLGFIVGDIVAQGIFLNKVSFESILEDVPKTLISSIALY